MKKKLPLIIAFLIAIAAIAGVVILLVNKMSGDNNTNQTIKDDVTNVTHADFENEQSVDIDDYGLEELDVKEYFEKRAKIISITPVKESKNTLSEKDAVKEFEERGFITYPITTNYTYDGKYGDTINISGTSDDKHPTYETYFVSSKNELWIITIIDGSITATPSSYNINNAYNVPVLVSEAKEISSYDSSTNCIYTTLPKESAVDLRIIDRIDANSIDTLILEGD